MANKAKSKAGAKRPVFHSSKLSVKENEAVNDMIKKSWKNGRTSGRRSVYAYAEAVNAKTSDKCYKIDNQSVTSFRKGMNIPNAKWVEKQVYVGDRIGRTKVYARAGRWYKPGDPHYDDVKAVLINKPSEGSA